MSSRDIASLHGLPSQAWARRGALALWDILAWGLGVAVVLGVRLDFNLNDLQWRSVTRYWLISALLLLAVGYATTFYRGRFRVGSFEEALGLATLFASVGVIGLVLVPTLDDALPRSLPVLAPSVALLGAALGRYLYRLWRDRSSTSQTSGARRALIYGAGDAGYQVLKLLRNAPGSDFHVVGLLDDNPGKRHLRLNGERVLGSIDSLSDVAGSTSADVVILAIPSASGDMIGRVQDAVQSLGMDFLVLPPVTEMLGGRVVLGDIRRVEIDDVLGRHPVTTELAEIADYLTDQRVLITGAGGSIGAELARQVHQFSPQRLILLDRDESALHATQLSIYGQGLLTDNDTELADIRDVEALREVFVRHRPDIVFHAAALKHLPLLERFPQEGWKTNVQGSLNILELAAEFGVARLVNVSTDKAADATSVLGRTKRLAERLTSWQAAATGRPYISVRFGNVLGSRGSMLPTFTGQIERGGPITVTHPDVTRYFMTIPEACQLVIQSGAIGERGEIMVLNMGTPVRILDVARRMIALSGRDIKIVFTGLREGEKLHERLFSETEDPRPTRHELIRTVEVPPLDPKDLASTITDDVWVAR